MDCTLMPCHSVACNWDQGRNMVKVSDYLVFIVFAWHLGFFKIALV